MSRAPTADESPDSAPRYAFVPDLPDLIVPDEYAQHPAGRLIRLRISITEDGVELLADGFRPVAVEALLEALGPDEIEQMLCG